MSTAIAKGQLDQDELFVESDDENENANKYLLFNLSDEIYGVNIESITEIIEMLNITSLPDMPAFIKGVINLRGRVIPVMDLRLRLGMPEREYDDRTCVIIARHENTSMGVIVDTVAEVNSITDENIEPAPEFNSENEKMNIVNGIGKVSDSVTLLIDVQCLMDREAAHTE